MDIMIMIISWRAFCCMGSGVGRTASYFCFSCSSPINGCSQSCCLLQLFSSVQFLLLSPFPAVGQFLPEF